MILYYPPPPFLFFYFFLREKKEVPVNSSPTDINGCWLKHLMQYFPSSYQGCHIFSVLDFFFLFLLGIPFIFIFLISLFSKSFTFHPKLCNFLLASWHLHQSAYPNVHLYFLNFVYYISNSCSSNGFLQCDLRLRLPC